MCPCCDVETAVEIKFLGDHCVSFISLAILPFFGFLTPYWEKTKEVVRKEEFRSQKTAFWYQCCGSEIIFSGSGSYLDLNFGSGSGLFMKNT
jgi:hypothetical protein